MVVTAITLIQTCPLSTLFEIVLTVKCRSDGCGEINRAETIEIGQTRVNLGLLSPPADSQTSLASVDVSRSRGAHTRGLLSHVLSMLVACTGSEREPCSVLMARPSLEAFAVSILSLA